MQYNMKQGSTNHTMKKCHWHQSGSLSLTLMYLWKQTK